MPGIGWRIHDGLQRLLGRGAPVSSLPGRVLRLAVRGLAACLTFGTAETVRRVLRSPRLAARLHRAAPDETILDRQYEAWLAQRRLTPERVAAIRSHVGRFRERPTVSLVMPVFDAPEEWLRAAIDSVRGQIYSHWELCIVDDASTAAHVPRVLAEATAADPRIRTRRLDANEGICGASNHALGMATGTFVGFLDHDDTLTADALYECVARIDAGPAVDLLYTDQDSRDARGRRNGPLFKPGWSPDLLLSMNYVGHFCMIRRSLVEQVGAFRTGLEGSQDHDLILRVTEHTDRVAHVPLPLYSWGRAPGSAALDPKHKPAAHEAGKRAVRDALVRRGIAGEVTGGSGQPFRYRVQRTVVGAPLVSIVAVSEPGRGAAPLRDRIAAATAYAKHEIIVAEADGTRALPALLNAGARDAGGEYVLFLQATPMGADRGWLDAMLEHAQRSDVGAVGGKLVSPDGTLEHVGLVIGPGERIGAPFAGRPSDDPGHLGLANAIRDCSAVSAACLMVRRAIFEEIGGFDEGFVSSHHDIDLCLRLRERGLRIVFTPYARLLSSGPSRTGLHHDADGRRLRGRWRTAIEAGDSFFSPCLTLGGVLVDADDARSRIPVFIQ